MAKVNLGRDSSGRPLILDDTWIAKWRVAEQRLGIKLTVIQGSYRAGPGALNRSGGTHDKGGAGDFRTRDIPKHVGVDKVVRVLRECGFVCWARHASQGFPDQEIHALDYGNPNLSLAAKAQIVMWEHGRNGLTGPHAGPDDGPRVKIPKKAPAMVKPLSIDLVDLSHHNTVAAAKIQAAVKAGVKGFYLKATEGKTFTDPAFARNRKLVAVAKVPAGAYHFARPSQSDGTTQARHFLAVAKPKRGSDFRVMLDLEDRGGKTKAQLTRWLGEFVAEVNKQTGVKKHLIYTSFDLGDNFGWSLWVARYHPANEPPRVPSPWREKKQSWKVRQFSGGQKAQGVPGSVAGLGFVDLNHVVGSVAALKLPAAPAPKPTPAPTPKPHPNAVTFTVHLAPGNKHQTPKQIAGDMVHVKAHGLVFTTEHDSPAERVAVRTGLGPSWTTAFDNEDVMGYSTALFTKVEQRSVTLAKDDPFKAGVSPTRKANVLATKVAGLSAAALVSGIGTHTVSEANCIHVHVEGRAWREKTYKIQINDLVRETRAELAAGRAVVLAGDMNTGKFFTTAQLLARLQKEFGKANVTLAYSTSLDAVILISSRRVRLTAAGKPTKVRTSSDHPMGIVAVTATELA